MTGDVGYQLGQKQLQAIIDQGLQRLDDTKLKYTIADHDFVVKDKIAQAADLILWAKGFISQAVQASPQASIAWAGVSIILPLFTNPKTAEDANRDGFNYVTTRMHYYAEFETQILHLVQNRGANDAANKFNTIIAQVVKLYENILDFQLRSVLRFYESRLRVALRDIVQYDDWKRKQEKIRDLEATLCSDLAQIGASKSLKELEHFNKASMEFLRTVQRFLPIYEEQLDVAREHLAIQKDIAKRNLSDKEAQCHQLFRVTADSKDVSYEWYKNRVDDRLEGTCQWFLNHENFHQWLKVESGPLLVSADPGCGKSVLAKYLIDRALPRSAPDASICYFFFKDQDQNTARQALCALLHQLFSHKPLLIHHAMPKYEKDGQALINTTASLWDILGSSVLDLEAGSVIFVLDALDECLESEFRDLAWMFKQLHWNMQRQGYHGKMKTLMTCRPYEGLVTQFWDMGKQFPCIRIPGEDESEAISREVNVVIAHRVEQFAREREFPKPVEDFMRKRLLEFKHRTYLWVYLVFDFLRKYPIKKTMKGVETVITMVPDSVNQAYEKILSKYHESPIVRKALSIILGASRPLTLAEMNVALNYDTSLREIKDLDLEAENTFQSRLRSLCGLFVSVYHDKVYFLHQTAREFLLAHPLQPATSPSGPQWRNSITSRDAHKILAEVCVGYLNLFDADEVLESSGEAMQNPTNANFNTALRDMPHTAFLDYSANNWADHFRDAGISSSSGIFDSALELYDKQSKSCSTWFSIFKRGSQQYHPEIQYPLHLASYFGHAAIVERLLNKADFNSRDSHDKTTLHWAARNGHENIARLLLDRGANTKAQAGNSLTPLHWAAENGHENMARLLLDRGANIEAQDSDSLTPLYWAVRNGHENTARLLLDRGASIEAQDSDSVPLLLIANPNGHENMLRLLLDRAANNGVQNRNALDMAPP
ncbi:Vegetative incompatibility protein HET-E-1 [Madurella mycetomatis]|uniref:Vegetative incompatibility protein HET-E-1 n=1 Tax=Madurella mycetomatis TaxID=100816 RepID=A0A175VVG4_9PEZI|nr:Vegetative incompatibility protein HET-E-1 [Madurella mycetomatis]